METPLEMEIGLRLPSEIEPGQSRSSIMWCLIVKVHPDLGATSTKPLNGRKASMRVVATSRRAWALVLSMSTACVMACHVTPDNLSGVYDADYEYARERLVLIGNGTFEQTVRRTDKGIICRANGTWRLGEGGAVEFNGMLLTWRTSVGAGCPSPETAVLPAERFIVTLIEVPDHFYYRKWK